MEITIYKEFSIDLMESWNALLTKSVSNVPFLRFEYLSDWWKTRGGGEWPASAELSIMVGREGDQVLGIAPFFIADHESQKRLLLLGSVEISDFLDLIVAPENEKAFLASLLKYFTDHLVPAGVQAMDLYNLLESSATVSLITQTAQMAGFSVAQTRLQQAPSVSLPGDWDAYLESIDKKQRHEIRRKMRRATEGEISIEVSYTQESAKVEKDSEAFMALMAQDPEKEAFLTPAMREQFRLSIRHAFDNGYLQLAFLKVGGKNAAAYLNFDYDNRIWVYNSGIDRSFMEYSPGWVLLGHLLQWANENQRADFDFMRGNEDYKYKFGAVDRFVCRLTITK